MGAYWTTAASGEGGIRCHNALAKVPYTTSNRLQPIKNLSANPN